MTTTEPDMRKMAFPMNSAELAIARKAVDILIGNYENMRAKETIAVHKQDLQNYIDAGHRFKYRLRHAVAKGPFMLSHGELSVFERCLRMSMNYHQVQIKKGMPEEERKKILKKSQASGDLLTRLRNAKGLPW